MRLSHQTKLVLQVFLDAPTEETFGFDLAQASGLPSGTVYPILRRLEDSGWVTSRWDTVEEAAGGRRRRCYYRLTGKGASAARAAVAPSSSALRQLVPGWSA